MLIIMMLITSSRVYYQAKINRDGLLMGFEALIRWLHPSLGMISPGEFIPIAEHSGKGSDSRG